MVPSRSALPVGFECTSKIVPFLTLPPEFDVPEVLDRAFEFYTDLTGWELGSSTEYNVAAVVPIEGLRSNADEGNPVRIARPNYAAPPGWYAFLHELAHLVTILSPPLTQLASRLNLVPLCPHL